MNIRRAEGADADAVWEIFREVIRGGDTYVFDENTTRKEAVAYWLGEDVQCFVMEEGGVILGAHTLRPNRPGRGAHVANASFIVSSAARGRGIGETLGRHALEEAKRQGYRAMQFNFVVSTNEGAVKLWQKLGFRIVGTAPGGFRHAALGMVDAYIMFREL